MLHGNSRICASTLAVGLESFYTKVLTYGARTNECVSSDSRRMMLLNQQSIVNKKDEAPKACTSKTIK